MDVRTAILSRTSIRAFLPTPVPRETVTKILNEAARAPSGGNIQPWHVYVVTGAKRDRIAKTVTEKFFAGQTPTAPYNIYPPQLKQPYAGRRKKNGGDLYDLLEVPRADKVSKLKWLSRNFNFFGAPVGLFFTLDQSMDRNQWAHVGMFLQNIMLLAKAYGLDTCAQEAWASWHELLRDELEIPANEVFFCGMALGFADPAHKINNLTTDRETTDVFCKWFEDAPSAKL